MFQAKFQIRRCGEFRIRKDYFDCVATLEQVGAQRFGFFNRPRIDSGEWHCRHLNTKTHNFRVHSKYGVRSGTPSARLKSFNSFLSSTSVLLRPDYFAIFSDTTWTSLFAASS